MKRRANRLHGSSAAGFHETPRDTSKEEKKKLIGQRGESIRPCSKRQRYSTGSTSTEGLDNSGGSTAIWGAFGDHAGRDRAGRAQMNSPFCRSLKPHTWTPITDPYKPHDDNLLKALTKRLARKPVVGRQLGKDSDVKQHKQKERKRRAGLKRRNPEKEKKKLIGQRNESRHTHSKSQTSSGSTGIEETDDIDVSTDSAVIQDPAVLKPIIYSSSHTSLQQNTDLYKPHDDNLRKTLAKQWPRKPVVGRQLGKDSDVKQHKQKERKRRAGLKRRNNSAKNNKLTRSNSLPDILFKEFTPVITPDFDDETYRFQFSCPGLYQCSVTGLVFHMEGEGDVVYRTVPWNRRLLGQHHKKPAGPLFDIRCLQQSVCQLHLPHCEIRSTGGCQFLSVAHVNDEDIEFISPHKITETHVVINITGFSGFGNVKDEDSPPDPVKALVLLFYRPPDDPDLTSFLDVLMLPRNVVLRDVQRTRRKLIGDEMYIEPSPHCKLQPNQVYTLSTCPEGDSVLVQPTEAEFDEEFHSSYFTSFQVILKTVIRTINLSLTDSNSYLTVWKREVYLPLDKKRQSYRQGALPLPSSERLLDVRSSFIDGISGPVLKSLLDKLLEKKVINDSERESVDEMENQRDKARFVIDTVRKKGEAASSEMIEFLCKVDPFLCEHLGLNQN